MVLYRTGNVSFFKHKGPYYEMLPRIMLAGGPESFDLIYSGGSHRAPDVQEDLNISL
jgi:hypothetical protein